ncbi:hypothetical protein E2C01_010075 [Portunus trituberculatus]|uniref:Uncharacterized protein n=1 Tax=Portunus trituberculatus TaxID=210409 RepID=A0A5B7D7Q2_PORTR|nr:hypothetical protein [Portunus trituberculatus]
MQIFTDEAVTGRNTSRTQHGDSRRHGRLSLRTKINCIRIRDKTKTLRTDCSPEQIRIIEKEKQRTHFI